MQLTSEQRAKILFHGKTIMDQIIQDAYELFKESLNFIPPNTEFNFSTNDDLEFFGKLIGARNVANLTSSSNDSIKEFINNVGVLEYLMLDKRFKTLLRTCLPTYIPINTTRTGQDSSDNMAKIIQTAKDKNRLN